MPLIEKRDIAQSSQMYIWRVEEDISTVADAYRQKISCVKSSQRQIELIGEFHLAMVTEQIGKIKYLDNGKPVLDEGFISISHDQQLIGFYLSSIPIGMDIQRPTEQLERVKHKFCNEAELKALEQSETSLRDLTLIWGAKEAIFKIYGEDVAFANGMHVTIGETTLRCKMAKGKIHNLEFFDLDGSLVVYSVS
jgi:phosphopantetheinyl transferase